MATDGLPPVLRLLRLPRHHAAMDGGPGKSGRTACPKLGGAADLCRVRRELPFGVELEHGADLAVRVLDARGAPAPDVVVRCLQPRPADAALVGKVWLRLEDEAIHATIRAEKYEELAALVGADVVERWTSNEGGELEVSDDGCGMSRGFIEEQLFKPFSTTKSGGFGIGLYQVKGIVEAHGGKIDVESGVGRGSSFRILLPKETV